MRCGPLPTDELVGAVLAHALRLPGGVLPKGRILGVDDVRRIHQAGLHEVHAAVLGPDDIPENLAARRITACVTGAGLRMGAVATGRGNLFAAVDGILCVDVARLAALNGTDEALTLATLTTGTRVRTGELVATAKVIPLAVPEQAVAGWEGLARAAPVLSVEAFRSHRPGLVLTRLGEGTPRSHSRSVASLRQRVEACGSPLGEVAVVDHRCESVAAELSRLLAGGHGPLLVLGATQVADRGDVIPQAIESLGGRVHRFGIPVDPGNLVLWGEVRGTTVLGVPGCARSPKRSGFDRVLERVLAGLPLDEAFTAGLGHGGLLKEVSERGRPRLDRPARRVSASVAGILLAAGASRRMGNVNKLLEDVEGEPMARRAARTLLDSGLSPVVVVTGHDAAAVEATMTGLDVTIRRNPHHGEGMSTSLRTGLDALAPADGRAVDGAVIALADMPLVATDDVRALIRAFAPRGREAVCVPVNDRKRGNPVLWGAAHFPAMRELTGDEGARRLLGTLTDSTLEVHVDHEGILRDVDTPDVLSALRDAAHDSTPGPDPTDSAARHDPTIDGTDE